MATVAAVAVTGAAGAAAAPALAVARGQVRPAPCARIQISTFSTAQMAVTRNYWTPRRIAAAAMLGQPGAGKAPLPAVPASQKPVAKITCGTALTVGHFSGAPLAPKPPSGSRVGTTFAGYENVGELFETNGSTLTPHCTASTISPPSGVANPQGLQLLIMTSAHCVQWVSHGVAHPVTNLAFVPQFDSLGKNDQPFGLWVVNSFSVDVRWQRCASGCPPYDYAILVLQPNNGIQLGQIVGANGWNLSEPRTVDSARLVGYPNAHIRPLLTFTKVVTVRESGQNYRRANSTPSFTGGTSGGPFFASYDTKKHVGMLFGDIGGYQQGGYSASPSYSPDWTSAFAQLVATAFAAEREQA